MTKQEEYEKVAAIIQDAMNMNIFSVKSLATVLISMISDRELKSEEETLKEIEKMLYFFRK